MHQTLKLISVILLLLSLGACSSTSVRTTSVTPVVQGEHNIPEEQLVDIGIELFNPGLDKIEEDDFTAYPEIRLAEARFIPYRLMETMQASANWGAVRLIPAIPRPWMSLSPEKFCILTGESMSLDIRVSDATGLEWFQRKYEAEASLYSYQNGRNHNLDPFQDIYNRIAIDIAQYRKKLTHAEVKKIRTHRRIEIRREFFPGSIRWLPGNR